MKKKEYINMIFKIIQIFVIIYTRIFLGLLGELGCSKTSVGLPFWKRNVSGNKLEYVFKFLFPCLMQMKNYSNKSYELMLMQEPTG